MFKRNYLWQMLELITKIAAIVLLTTGTGIASEVNLVANPGFEKGELEKDWCGDNWIKYCTQNGTYCFDASVKYGGKRSIRVEPTAGGENQCGFYQGIKLVPGNLYKVGGWIRSSSDFNGRVEVVGNLELADGTVKYSYISFASDKKMVNSWAYYEKEFKTPENELKSLALFFIITGDKGCVWFDDVSIAEVSAENEPVSVNTEKFLMIGKKADSPPVIDGIIDDACWEKAISVPEFQLLGSGDSPKERTEAYLTQDDKNLYVAFKCYESALDPANQIIHQFKARQKEHDSQIFTDDCVEVFLNLKNRDLPGFYQLAVNPMGTSFEAYYPEGSTPDKSWDPVYKVKTLVEKGFWTVEMAIPFSELNVGSPEEGTIWGIKLCREEQPRKELSSWPPATEGFSVPTKFGDLSFGNKEPPFLSVVSAGKLEVGKNIAILKVTNNGSRSKKLNVQTKIIYSDGKIDLVSKIVELAEQQEKSIEVPYEIAERDGDFRLDIDLLDAGTNKTYYSAPGYRGRVITRPVNIKVACDGEYSLYLNGDEIGKYEKNNGVRIYQTRAKEGTNVIGLIAEGEVMQAEVDFLGGGKVVTDSSWRYSIQKEEDWLELNFDDSGWKRVSILERKGLKEMEESPAQHVWSEDTTDKRVYFRKLITTPFTMLELYTRKGVKYQPPLYICKDSYQHLFLKLGSPPDRNVNNLKFIIDVPEGFAIEEVGCMYKKHNPSLSKGIAKRKDYQRYIVSFDEKLVPYVERDWSPGILDHVALLFYLQKNFEGKESKFYYHTLSNDDNITEMETEFPVSILPSLSGRQPKKITITGWGMALSLDNDKIEDGLMETYRKSGFNAIGGADISMPGEQTHKKGLKSIGHTYYWEHLFSQYRRIDSKGEKVTDNNPCSTYFTDGDGWKYIERHITEAMSKYHHDGLLWDCESNPVEHGCFCPDCLESFKKKSGITGNLTIEDIKSRYLEEWINFRCWQTANFARKVAETIKSLDPEAVMWVYSGYPTDNTRREYSVDWTGKNGWDNAMGKSIALALCGYGRVGDFDAINRPVVGSFNSSWNCVQASKIDLLRLITDTGGGIMIWEWLSLDGRTFQAVSEVSRIISDFEEIFLTGKKDNSLVKVLDESKDVATVWVKGEERLILLFNETNVEKVFNVKNLKLPQEKNLLVLDYDKKEIISSISEIKVRVPPNDIKILFIGPKGSFKQYNLKEDF